MTPVPDELPNDSIYNLIVEARGPEGNNVTVKLEGFTEHPTSDDIMSAYEGAATLYRCAFDSEPEGIGVRLYWGGPLGIDSVPVPVQSYEERREAERNIGFQTMDDHRAAWPCSDCRHYNHPDRTICAKCGHDKLEDEVKANG